MTGEDRSPSSTVEDYLKALFVHQQEHPDDAQRLVSLGQISRGLGVTPGTVTTMIKGLAQAGYAKYESRRGARLTDAGERLALKVLRRHRLIELFLVEIVGYDWSEVHDDAEILEHAVSDKLLERMDAMLGHPTADPHGDPIPPESGKMRSPSAQPLSLVPTGRYEITRVLDHSPSFLGFLQERKLVPGAPIRLTERDEVAGVLTLQRDDAAAVVVSLAAAGRILVHRPTKDENASGEEA